MFPHHSCCFFCSHIEDNGLKAKASELPPWGNEAKLDEADEDEFCDEVSAMSLNDHDEDDIETTYKSVHFSQSLPSRRAGMFRGKKGLAPVVSASHLNLPYIMDTWTDEFLNKRVSLQFHLLSGDDPHIQMEWRVSTDLKDFVIEQMIDDYMMTPEGAFNTYLLNEKKVNNDKTGALRQTYTKLLTQHPKTIARRKVIAKMTGRDASKEKVMVQQRVPLPFKCQHRYITVAEDDLFNGAKLVVGPNNAVMLHVELIGEQTDSYSPMKTKDDAATVRSAKAEFLPKTAGMRHTGVPETIFCGSDDDSDDDSNFGLKTVDEDGMSIDKADSPAKSTRSKAKKSTRGGDAKSVTSKQSTSSKKSAISNSAPFSRRNKKPKPSSKTSEEKKQD